ncbi:SPOSA6832_01927 [Sporobolomyces salmonicolor]|uniref:SPOSA6832_01927-mRNA-1:cds n=1 Tax=Sporidiobolus salmonicolor TaxID=5005 RepID=A0A0D6EJV9_SPOSA|nr:SPOSA6832_01927 [Sporobolomyces salmonicolor]
MSPVSAAEPGAPVLAKPASTDEINNIASASRGGHSKPAQNHRIRPSSSSQSSHSGETLADDNADLAAQMADREKQGNDTDPPEDEVEVPPKPEAPGKEEDPFLVTLKGRESLNPHTWSVIYRWWITAFAGLLVLNATFASSAPSNLIPHIIEHFHVSEEVGILLISIFVAGYCVGPLLWGPLSERYGRRPIFLFVWPFYIGFQVGCALSKNIGSLIVFRFLGGCFASSPLTNAGGVIADLWDADRRGVALAVFSLMPFAGACGIGIIFILPETYVPTILHLEAKRLRKETGDDRWHAPIETKQDESFKAILRRTVLKPFIMIVEEPMLATLYMSLVYGVVYLLFEAIPIVFMGAHHLNAGECGLVFLALLLGAVFAVFLYIVYFNRQYMKMHHDIKPRMVPPEERLRPLFYASPLFAVAFFWFGWTAYPHISIWSPILAVFLLGMTILYVFLSGFNYMIGKSLLFSFGAGFPLFAGQMYRKLGTPGASSLLGGLAIVFVPVPFLLYKYGKKIRAMSKNAVVLDK